MPLARRRPLALLCSVWLAACVHGAPPVAPAPGLAPPAEPAAKAPEPPPAPTAAASPAAAPPEASRGVTGPDVEALLSNMSLDQKIGQVMMVGFSGVSVDDDVRQLIRGRQVGGVCLFKRNVVSAEQVARLNDELRGLLDDSVPPFIAVDQEGGNVVRISRGPVVLPGNMALGATREAHLAYEAGKAQGEDLRRLGFNMNLAPVLDINVNPRNPVIGIRSFGDRAELVSALGAEFVRGQQDANVVTIAKHFPGHGNTDADSHKALPVMSETEAEVLAQIAPFQAAIKQGLDGLMTAHVAIPKMTGDDLPATLSPKILTGLLRKQVGFDGLVLTDELEMEAIVERFGVGKAAVMAVSAGADMVLIPWRPEKKAEVHEALLAAAMSGQLPAARLDEAVRRILLAKARRGLFERPSPLLERLAKLGVGRQVAQAIARESVTLVRTDGRSFPLKSKRRIAVITAEAALGRAILARAPTAAVLVVPAYPKQAKRAALREQARALAAGAEVVVVGMINSRQLELFTMAAATRKPVVVVTMGLPYLAEEVDEAKAVLALYSYQEVSAEAAAAALFGEHGTPGKLPVSLPRWPFGHGLDPVGEQLAKKLPTPRERLAESP